MKNYLRYFMISILAFSSGAISVYALFDAYLQTVDRNAYARELAILESMVVKSDKSCQCVGVNLLLNEYEKKISEGPIFTESSLVSVLIGAYVMGAEFMNSGDYQSRLLSLRKLVNNNQEQARTNESEANPHNSVVQNPTE